jgi:hypothetical protein
MAEDDLVRELRSAGSPYADVIAEGLTSGSMSLVDRGGRAVPVKELLDIYTARREHLSKFSSEHGRNLHRDVASLCQQLSLTPLSSCKFLTITTSKAGESYTVFRDCSSGRVFGCCHTFSKLDLSPDEWEKLWNG